MDSDTDVESDTDDESDISEESDGNLDHDDQDIAKDSESDNVLSWKTNFCLGSILRILLRFFLLKSLILLQN